MNTESNATVIGYVMTRSCCSGWMFLGTEPTEVAGAIAEELRGFQEMGLQDIDDITIEAREFTQSDIDNMPEFQGW